MLKWLNNRNEGPAKAAAIEPQAPAPASGLTYDPGLIAEFLDTHRVLVSLHDQARNAAVVGDWAVTAASLEAFRTELTDHLVSEGIRLYVYLRLSLKDEPQVQAQMRLFAGEMHGIGAAITKYLDEVKDIATNPKHRPGFVNRWDQIGGTLVQRIQREERVLYPMYQPFSLN